MSIVWRHFVSMVLLLTIFCWSAIVVANEIDLLTDVEAAFNDAAGEALCIRFHGVNWMFLPEATFREFS